MHIHIQNKFKETIDSIDADAFVESFTLDPLSELLEQYNGTGKNLILARVDGSSYYYAQLLNKLVFRQLVVGPCFHILRIKASNPLTNMPIIGNIEYFLVEPVFASENGPGEEDEAQDAVGALMKLPRNISNLASNVSGIDGTFKTELPATPDATPASLQNVDEKQDLDRKQSVKRVSKKITQYIQKDSERTDEEAQKLADIENNVFILKISRNFNRRKDPAQINPDPDLVKKNLAVARLVEQGRQRQESAEYKTSGLRNKIMSLIEKSAELENNKGTVASVDDLAPNDDGDAKSPKVSTAMLPKLKRAVSYYVATYLGDEDDYLTSRSMRVVFFRYALDRTHYFPHHVNLKLLYKQSIPEWNPDPNRRGSGTPGQNGEQGDISKMKLVLMTIGGVLMLIVVSLCITIPILGSRSNNNGNKTMT